MQDRRILLGVTGCIAAYKAADLASAMVQRGADVITVMTHSATEFVRPLTFESLTRRPVYVRMFGRQDPFNPKHIALADWAEVMLVAPATANLLGKVANGIGDDLLSTLIMSADGPVMFAPAMNSRMWANPVVSGNIARLRELGYHFVEPESGYLACGTIGIGRLASRDRILDALAELLAKTPVKPKPEPKS